VPEHKAVVIVTGSSGFIGGALCRAFVSDGYSVVGFDRPDVLEPQPGVTNIPCDVTEEDSVAQAVSSVLRDFAEPLASVIHLAAYYDFSGEPSPLYEEVTVQGTERLIRLLKTAKPEQFVFSSTMLVHAPCEPGQHINEDWPLEPKWDYPQSKADTEKLILQHVANYPSSSCGLPACTPIDANPFQSQIRSNASTNAVSLRRSFLATRPTDSHSCTWTTWSTPSAQRSRGERRSRTMRPSSLVNLTL